MANEQITRLLDALYIHLFIFGGSCISTAGSSRVMIMEFIWENSNSIFSIANAGRGRRPSRTYDIPAVYMTLVFGTSG